jgi:hypothetical protein
MAPGAVANRTGRKLGSRYDLGKSDAFDLRSMKDGVCLQIVPALLGFIGAGRAFYLLAPGAVFNDKGAAFAFADISAKLFSL